jgi:hypothetical protein
MIRRARPGKPSWFTRDTKLPTPEQIRQLTAEIRKHWTPAQHARRAGQNTRVQVMVVSAVDLLHTPQDEP